VFFESLLISNQLLLWFQDNNPFSDTYQQMEKIEKFREKHVDKIGE